MNVRVRYWAAIRAAAGCKEEPLEVPDSASVQDLALLVIDRHQSAEFERILNGCSVLVDGRSVTRAARAETLLRAEQTVEFLPPFAGG